MRETKRSSISWQTKLANEHARGVERGSRRDKSDRPRRLILSEESSGLRVSEYNLLW